MADQMRHDALGRPIVLSMIHDDGHVAALANRGTPAFTVERVILQLHTLYSWMGVTGWAVQYLPVDDATAAFMRGQGCPRCTVVFGCGCSFQRVALRQCGHDTAARFHALAHVVGYCANDAPQHTGPPLPVVVRVYEAGSRHGHLTFYDNTSAALCGYQPDDTGWMGLHPGDEHQRATAARLPVCNACLGAVAQ